MVRDLRVAVLMYRKYEEVLQRAWYERLNVGPHLIQKRSDMIDLMIYKTLI